VAWHVKNDIMPRALQTKAPPQAVPQSAQLDKALLSLGFRDAFPALRKLEIEHGIIPNSYPVTAKPRLLKYIWDRREFFSANPALDFITDLPEKALDIAKAKEHTLSIRDVSDVMLKELRDEQDADLSYGAAHEMLSLYLSDDEKKTLKQIFDERRKANAGQTKIKTAILKPYAIRVPDGAAAEFLKETQRPARGDKCSSGGRAGLGKQKPDLWRP
jgi:hypothetical protein